MDNDKDWYLIYIVLSTYVLKQFIKYCQWTVVYDQEMGVVQGSILSVTLFIVKINSITSCIRNGVDKCLFFDVSYQSKHMLAIERQPQLHLSRKEDWADNNGFKNLPLKDSVHFSWRRGLVPEPYLVLYNNPIPVRIKGSKVPWYSTGFITIICPSY